MKEKRRSRKKILLGSLLFLASVLAAFVFISPQANYVWHAYFFPGSNSSLRGYPVVEPPPNYTGVWTHYTYSGRPLAIHNYVDGDTLGKQIYLKDDGIPYLVRYLNKQGWERDDVSLGPPPNAVIPWFFPQRWINRSLDRFAILDKLFHAPPAVIISEEDEQDKDAKDKKQNKIQQGH